MSYRPPSHPPETAWARHLDQVMRDRDWSRVRLFEEIGAELGYKPKSRSAILPLLVDKEPTSARAAVLRRYFGDPPVPVEAVPVDPEPTLASALSALARELQASREERETMEERLRTLEAAVQHLAGQADAESPMRSVRRASAG